MILEKGRVCIVRRGRDFGKVCLILEAPKQKDFEIFVEGPKLKKCKKNVSHLWPLDLVVGSVKDIDKKVKI
ncbi:MAG: hypothetical protein COT14_01720 [Candidatus Diapherotrites archaeon CG08_land_8_20_14_0_20_30_16]|nr:MAG: hypothetical protein COT14_01720 [Candidatus Diapherotrites archaeon CG08_land_8_20_14_0_20_30_16]